MTHLQDAEREVQALAEVVVEQSRAPGVAVLLREGDSVRMVTEGTSDTRRPLTAQTRFPVGSITKTMAAAAALSLRDRGDLALDDTVQDWLPELLPDRPVITVEQLLNHSSGLFNVTDDPSFRLGTKSPEEVVAAALGHGIQFPPGTKHEYSNTGYIALGMVMEKASGHTLGDLLAREVFGPAQMRNTSLPARYPTDAVRGYYNGEDITFEQLRVAWAAAGVVSTLRDLDSFFKALFDGKLIRGESLRLMRRTQPMTTGFDAYGLGLVVTELDCGTAYGHGGSLPGITTDAWVMPERGRFTVALVNTEDFAAPNESLVDIALCA